MDAAPSVLLDGRPLRPPLSGVGHYVRSLARALLDAGGVGLGILEFDFLGRQRAFRESLGIDFARTSAQPHHLLHRKVFNAGVAYGHLPVARLLGHDAFDLVHETYFERLGPTRRARGRRQARVSTIHDVAFLRHPEWFDKRNLAASRRALATQLRCSDVILTPSAFTRSELVGLAGVDASRIVITPLGAQGASSGDARPAPVGRPYALYVGNIDPRKNLPLLVEAWSAAGLGREYDLKLVGAPIRGNETFAGRLARMGDSGVSYLGYVSEEERERLLAGASCFVYPSHYEGFGLPVLEAMRAGIPVVVSAAPALVELVGSAGRVVVPATPQALGAALAEILHDDALQVEMSAAGRLRAEQFDWAVTARTTLAAYRLALQV